MSNRINTGERGTKSARELANIRTTNIQLGFVRDTSDPQRMGRLKVWIPELGPDIPDAYVTVSYASPFAGATNIEEVNADDKTETGSQRSYGFWAVPPDIGNQVLICFVNGDPGRGFWFGCIYQQNMNHMVPGVGMNISTDPEMNKAFAPYSPPVVEYNKKDLSLTPDAPPRPARSEFAQRLLQQGLAHDPERGVSNSSARREDTSKVQGWLTPGGSSISFDDDPANSFIRLRSKSGAQVMISETSGFIYMITKEGNSWVEISDGAIDLYSSAPISLRSEDDVNIIADGDLNLDAKGDVNIHAGGSIRGHAGDDVALAAGGVLAAKAGGDIGLTAGGAMVADATGVNARNGAVILDNAGGGPAKTPTFKEASSVGNGGARATVASAVPSHEPYGHPINASIDLVYDDDNPRAGGRVRITRSDGSQIEGVTEEDTSPVRKISGFDVSDKVNGCIMAASQRTGIAYTTLMAVCAAESGFNPNRGAKKSSAKGLFQFIDDTWAVMYRRYGPGGTVVRNANVKNNPHDACSNALLGAYYIKENQRALAAAGLGTGPTELYMAHFLGTGGGRKFLRAKKQNPNLLARAGANSDQLAANYSIFYKKGGQMRTLQEVYNLLHARTGATVPQWAAYQKKHSG